VDASGHVRYAGQGIARSQTLLSVVRAVLGGESVAPVPVRLAFDDFPSRDTRLDDRLLDILRVARVHATFHGDNARRETSPAITRHTLAEGHRIQGAFGAPGRGIIDPFD
jgi:peptidoglycan/xylan/chitin deacetylase (PgdA/CDA1 family)